MGDHLATIDMGRKVGLRCHFQGRVGSQSNTMSPGPRPTSVLSGIFIHPAVWPQQTWAENWGLLCPFFWRGLGPHLTQCGLGRDLPPCQMASWSIQPFGHNRHRLQIIWMQAEPAPINFESGGCCAPFRLEELGPHRVKNLKIGIWVTYIPALSMLCAMLPLKTLEHKINIKELQPRLVVLYEIQSAKWRSAW